ncbi:hypothetical protein K466DRAFT_665476 [Polyporus arcularius HHB13444]|uniref:F-box domain-containing protein n=1 Tax=Polyporus arcularius HHB13444 TaxID=1314778 RepID=A0A5C3P5V4_9APHY|nr:hypothetical protein K466DRAFT_665476 [Polyporus arcularius HHB13444]
MPSPGAAPLFANHQGWGALANELRVHILKELDATDLLSCSKVARAFKTLVDKTPSLRYRLLLYAAGMRDGQPAGGSSVLKRLTLLEEYENTWKTGNIPIRQQPSRGHHKHGGLIVTLDCDQSQLDVLRPASFFSGVPERAWHADLSNLLEQGGPDLDPGFGRAYAVDLAQDLLVLMVLPEVDPELEESAFPECHVLSLSGDGETHPLAARRDVYNGSNLGFSSPQADVEIVGDLIGCTVLGMDLCMSVYNWKTGLMIWCDSEWDEDMGEMEYHTRCHILDPTHVLKVSKYDLIVHRVAEEGKLIDGEIVCNLAMPALADGFEASYCASHIQRPPEMSDCSPHFECDPSLTVLVVEYDISRKSSLQRDNTKLIAVIPISTILARAHASLTTPKISWEDWGALGARLVLMPSRTSYSEHINVFGSRVTISVPRPSQQGMADVVVLDVREGVVHAEGSRSATECEGISILVLDRFTKEVTPVFKNPVEAKMPYRMRLQLAL